MLKITSTDLTLSISTKQEMVEFINEDGSPDMQFVTTVAFWKHRDGLRPFATGYSHVTADEVWDSEKELLQALEHALMQFEHFVLYPGLADKIRIAVGEFAERNRVY